MKSNLALFDRGGSCIFGSGSILHSHKTKKTSYSILIQQHNTQQHIMVVFLIRRAVKRVKAIGYKLDLEELNKEGPPKLLAIVDVEVTTKATMGITGRPSVLMPLKEWKKSALGRNKRTFVALETAEGKVIFLLLEPKIISDDSDDLLLLEGAKLDTGFARDRGISVLTAENTIVTQKVGCEDVFVFECTEKCRLKPKRESYEIKVIVDPANGDSQANAFATIAWLETIAQE
jgi:hypothetical protein